MATNARIIGQFDSLREALQQVPCQLYATFEVNEEGLKE